MEIMTEITEVPWEKTAIAIGKFEGLHTGHQKLIRHITAMEKEGFVPLVFTFDQSPRIYFGQRTGMLFTKEERRRLFEAWNISCLAECRFTKELAAMEARDFLEHILIGRLHAGCLAVGPDFCFGKDRKGGVGLLKEYQAQNAFQLEIIEKEFCGGFPVSSTRIREHLEAGQLSEAREMLGFPFFLCGRVVRGNCLGRTWGIPTANIMPDPEKLLPPNGVYLSRVLAGGRHYRGITNIGNKPTVGDHYERGAETYIYDFSGDIYGEEICVELLHFQRKEQKFDSVEQLARQLAFDVECGRCNSSDKSELLQASGH